MTRMSVGDGLHAPVLYRIKAAFRVAFLHLLISLCVAGLAAILVFVVWYPSPYWELSGGQNLFFILMGVDVICGPLLTFVLFNPKKSRREFFVDMALIVVVQLSALVYGLHATYQARPLFLVHEVDRFRVIARPDYDGQDVDAAFSQLPREIRPRWSGSPVTVGIRTPKDNQERQAVMFDAISGGRDYSARPEFYVPYNAEYAPKVLARARPLRVFADKYQGVEAEAVSLLRNSRVSLDDALFLPVMHRQEWVVVLDQAARVLGFLPGDGFEARD